MRALKWVGYFLLAGVVLLAVLFYRAWTTPAIDLPAARAFAPLPIDQDAALRRFAGAVRLRTVSTADAAPSADDLRAFHDYLEQQFPLVHQRLQREILDGGGLLYTWSGKNSAQAPILLMAHQDTVPIEPGTESKWTHDPFSGEIAGGMVWGRGALDDKASLVSIFEAAEILLARGFAPERTIYFAFGSDEERGGKQGAGEIVALLKKRRVHAQFVLDEGGAVTRDLLAGVKGDIALIGVAEKGYLSVNLVVTGAGGHSSAPPKETAIGILSRAMSRLETNPMPTKLTPPVDAMFDTIAPLVPFTNRLVLRNRWLLASLLVATLQKSPTSAGMVRTTTAETMFHAGIKDNVLPTEARATVNFRLLPGDTVESVLAHMREVIGDGRVALQPDTEWAREASPVSPLDGAGLRAVRATIGDVLPGVPATPYLVTAATDASYYREVSDEQLRFVPYTFTAESIRRFHGIDEAIPVDDYLRCVRFAARLIENAASGSAAR